MVGLEAVGFDFLWDSAVDLEALVGFLLGVGLALDLGLLRVLVSRVVGLSSDSSSPTPCTSHASSYDTIQCG